MATKKWVINRNSSKEFIKLSNDAKLLFRYLEDLSDTAGFGIIDYPVINIVYNFNDEKTNKLLKELNYYVVVSDDGNLFWLRRQLGEQSNLPLDSINNNNHKGILKRISENIFNFRSNVVYFAEIPAIVNGKISSAYGHLSDKLSVYLTDDVIITRGFGGGSNGVESCNVM